MKPSPKPCALLLALLLLSGCASLPAPGPARRDATAALVARPDFPAVVRASPEWVTAALHTITALEAELAAAPK